MSHSHAADDGASLEARPARRPFYLVRIHRERWADDRELAHAKLGTVVGAAAMAAASPHGTLGEVVVTVLVTVAVYWAAERYARVLAVAVPDPTVSARSAPCSGTDGRWSRRRTRRSSCSW
jgi:hypothetical protein